jgi:hypothetical protein
MKKIVAIVIMALFLLGMVNFAGISQSEIIIDKSNVEINFIDSGSYADEDTGSQIYGFIVPVSPSQSYDQQTKIIRLVNEILNNNLKVYWVSKDQIKSTSDGNIVLDKGGYIIPFTGDCYEDSIVLTTIESYENDLEIKIITSKIYDINAYKLVAPKIADFTYRYNLEGCSNYLYNLLGFTDYEHLSWEDINPKLNNNDFNVFIWPGGNGQLQGLIEDQFHSQAFNKIRSFVGNGGGYIGFCYGGYEASKGYILPLNLLKPYLSENPIIPPFLSIIDAYTFRALPGLGGVTIKIIDSDNPLTFGLNQVFSSQYAAGPIFLNCKGETKVVGVIDSISENFAYGEGMPINWFLEDFNTELSQDVMDRWASYSIGKPTWVTSNFGSGKIAVFGDHPEYIGFDYTTGVATSSPRVLANSLFYTTSEGPFDVDITIGNCSNLPPLAYDDNYKTSQNTSLNVRFPGVLSNDVDPNGEILIARKTNDPKYGDLINFNSDGSFKYIPNPGYKGEDSFTYEIENTRGTTDTAIVHIKVVPIANDDYYSVKQYEELYKNCLNNDDYFSYDIINARLTSYPQHGIVMRFGTHGSFRYISNDDNYTGLDSFNYELEDSKGNKDTATVYITIEPATKPLAKDDNYVIEKNKNLIVMPPGVLKNDVDILGSGLITRKNNDPKYGKILYFGINGGFIYKPKEDFTGSDWFAYKIIDKKGRTDAGFVNIYVSDNIPIANDDYYTMPKNNVLTIKSPGILENDISNNEEDLKFKAYKIIDPEHGTLNYLNSDGSFSYLPDQNYVGSDSFTYKAWNGDFYSEPATVHITITQTNTWYVDDDAQLGGDGSKEYPFKTITEALNKADTYLRDIKDTIFVNPGTYYENLEIKKSINLIGIKDRGFPKIKISNSNKNAIHVLASDVKIENFIVEDVAGSSSYAIKVGKNGILPITRIDINNCNLFYCSNGILFDNVKSSTISSCSIFAKETGNYINGILITDGSKRIDISNCEIVYFDKGINVASGSNIKLSKNLVGYNKCAIYFDLIPFSDIIGNKIWYNNIGININYCVFSYNESELKRDNDLKGNTEDIIIENICENLTADPGGPYSASTSVTIGGSSDSIGTGGSQDATGQQGQIEKVTGGTATIIPNNEGSVTATDSEVMPILSFIKNGPIKTRLTILFYKILNLLNRIRSIFSNQEIIKTSSESNDILSMLQIDQSETSKIGTQRSIDSDGTSSGTMIESSPDGTRQIDTNDGSRESSSTKTPNTSKSSPTGISDISSSKPFTTPTSTTPSSTSTPTISSPGSTTPIITTPSTNTQTTPAVSTNPGGIDSAPIKSISPATPTNPTDEGSSGGSATVYVTINFDGRDSQPRDQIKKYHWDFGDGNSKTSILARCMHTYTITVATGGDSSNEDVGTPSNCENFVANSDDMQTLTSGTIMNALATNTDVSSKPITTPSSGSTGSSSTQDIVKTFTVTLTVEDSEGNTNTNTTTVTITIHVTTNNPGTSNSPNISNTPVASPSKPVSPVVTPITPSTPDTQTNTMPNSTQTSTSNNQLKITLL